MYQKRNNIKKFFSIPKKGTKYVAVASHNKNKSVPLIVVIRDILKLVKNKKELKSILNEKQIKINNKEIREINYPICLFDVLTLVNGKNYRALLSKEKKMIFSEINEKEAKTKVYKVESKKMLSKKQIQLNLSQGKNILSKEKVNIGDSIVLNLEDNKIIKVIAMEKGKHAYVTQGKHIGQQGKIDELMERGGKKLAKISSDSERINVWVKNLIVTD
jgi:small subunit ribosomal protein S4e